MAGILKIRNPDTGEFVEIPALKGIQGDPPPLSTRAPLALGVAYSGSSTTASREDHIHPMPTAKDIGAASTEEFNSLKGDVAAITPDDTVVDGKPWTSQRVVDSLCMPLEETGNPVQVYPVEGYPLGVKVSWDPTQEGSGDPSPDNIRPITGRDAVSVERYGTKNLLDMSKCVPASIGQAYGLTVTIDGDMIHFSGVPNISKDENNLFFRLIKITQNALIENVSAIRLTVFDANFEYKNIYCASDGYVVINMKLLYGQEIDYTLRVMMSFDTPTAYEPYTGSTTDIALPETVYGGTLNAESGEGQETWKTLTMDGTEEWKSQVSNTPGKVGFVLYVPEIATPTTNVIKGDIVCSQYPTVTANDTYLGTNGISIESGKNHYIRIYNDTYAGGTIDEWKSYLAAQYAAGTPVQICYKLKEPEPFTATGAQTIHALSGVNTLYTDAGTLTVTGREDPRRTIVELKNAIISLGGNI